MIKQIKVLGYLNYVRKDERTNGGFKPGCIEEAFYQAINKDNY
jgi:hypothetical protein